MLRNLLEKPWLPQPDNVVGGNAAVAVPTSAERIALRFFLAIVGVIFFLFTITFLSRSQYPDFQALAGQPWQPLSNPWQLWLNTVCLLLACASLQWAVSASGKDKADFTRMGIRFAQLFAILFIVAQYLLWQKLHGLGFFVASNPANSYFYLFTGIHALHLLGGIIALARVSLKFRQNGSLPKLAANISLCATYWHFLFVIWLLLFALLASSPETYRTLAAMCGFLR